MSNSRRFATSEPTSCGVCRRHAVWLGYAPKQSNQKAIVPVMWLCDETKCHEAAKEVYNMPGQRLDLYEQHAQREAGGEAGAYLDELGITDLALMTAEQYGEFCRRMIVGFENALRTKILSGTAPF